MEKLKLFYKNLKNEIKLSYKEFLFKIFLLLGKKLFTVVSSISPNNQEAFVIFSNDERLSELVKTMATPSPTPSVITPVNTQIKASTKRKKTQNKKEKSVVETVLKKKRKI